MAIPWWYVVISMIGFVGMSGWVIYLDTRIEQREGYIKRLERELAEARAGRWRSPS